MVDNRIMSFASRGQRVYAAQQMACMKIANFRPFVLSLLECDLHHKLIVFRVIPGGPKKRPELSHGVMQQSR